jgi:transcriptional regulator with XRE-family HTH domain
MSETVENKDYNRSVCIVIIKKRNALGLSQAKVAADCGISRSLYGHYETGVVRWNADAMFKVFDRLGIDVYVKGVDGVEALIDGTL